MIRIIIFGTGSGCEKLKNIFDYNIVNIVAYVDNNIEKQGKFFDKIPIIKPVNIKNYKYDYIVIASSYYNEICEQLLYLGISDEKIISFYKEYEEIYGFKLKMILFNNMFQNDVETLITGISYAQLGIKAEKLKNKAFNFALVSQDLFYDYNIIKYLLKRKSEAVKNFKYAIIGLSYFSFQYDLSKSANNERVFKYYNILKDKHNYEDYKFKSEYSEFLKKLNLYDKIIDLDKLKKFVKKFMHEFDDNIMVMSESCEDAKKRAIKEANKNYPDTLKENKLIFDSYLRMLTQLHIKSIVVVLPTCKFYYENFSAQMKRGFYDIIEEFKLEYDFQFLDYFNCSLFDNKDFADCTHLNFIGAEKMTRILNNNIKW